MQERILDVNWPQGPTLRNSMAEYQSNGGGLDCRTKSVCKINVVLLVVSFGNEPSFVTFQGTVSFSFDLINPVATNKNHEWPPRNKRRGSIFHEGRELNIHSMSRLSIFIGLRKTTWFLTGRNISEQGFG